MRTLTIEQINELEHKEPIPSFIGTIKKVWEQKTGVGDYGPWFLQNLTVTQGDHEITVTWSGEDAFDAGSEGYAYSFECSHDKHDKLVGVMRDIRTSKGKTYKGIKVDNRSKIKRVPVEQGTQGAKEERNAEEALFGKEPDDAQQGTTSEPELQPSHSIESAASKAKSVSDDIGVQETRKHLMQSANLLVLCIKATEKAVAPHQPVVAQTSEQFQSDVAKLFIEASSRRTSDGVNWWSYVDRMPTHPIKNGDQ